MLPIIFGFQEQLHCWGQQFTPFQKIIISSHHYESDQVWFWRGRYKRRKFGHYHFYNESFSTDILATTILRTTITET